MYAWRAETGVLALEVGWKSPPAVDHCVVLKNLSTQVASFVCAAAPCPPLELEPPSPQSESTLCSVIVWDPPLPLFNRKVRVALSIVEPAGMLPATSNAIRPRRMEEPLPCPVRPEKRYAPEPLLLEASSCRVLSLRAPSVTDSGDSA